MSAPMRCMRAMFHHIYLRNVCHKCWRNLRTGKKFLMSNALRGSFMISASVLGPQISEIKLTPPDPTTLTHSYLIKNASTVAMDASSTVLSQVVASIIHTEKEYTQTMEELSELLEFQLQVLGHGSPQEQQVWDDIIATRDRLTTIKQTQQDLETLYTSVEKLMDASGEVAFFAGAQYATTCTGERLYSAKSHIAEVKAASKQAEDSLNLLEVKVIEETSKQEEKKKKRHAADEEPPAQFIDLDLENQSNEDESSQRSDS
ncbi:diablo IAP-binding mitochondrial protein-like [Haliotis cracherodii]|uniref:diablo IAP-binding mitochondrial protein-like n=1 Tax=Haliotis cracherodii TaxID=6455 RepID=UPI0039E93C86